MSTSAIITPVLAAGSTTSPYVFQVNITQRLCSSSCASRTPVFNPVFSLVGYSQVGTGTYMATISVEGLISYIPCNSTACCTKSQVVSQTFSLPFYSATAPTAVSITQGTVISSISASACQNCSRTFVSETPIYLTVSAS